MNREHFISWNKERTSPAPNFTSDKISTDPIRWIEFAAELLNSDMSFVDLNFVFSNFFELEFKLNKTIPNHLGTGESHLVVHICQSTNNKKLKNALIAVEETFNEKIEHFYFSRSFVTDELTFRKNQ